MAATTKTPEWHKDPISQGQARFIGQLLPGVFPGEYTAHAEGGGFGQWVPNWTEPEEGVYPSLHAANLLAELGITKGNASEAISYLKRMKGRGDARLSTLGERLGLDLGSAVFKPVQSSTSFDVQEAMARIAELQAALEQQLAVANGGEEDSGGAESSEEEEVEAEESGGSDSVLPF